MTEPKNYSDNMPMFDISDFRGSIYKAAIVFGALIVFYGILWLLVTLGVIPAVIAAIFPQIVIIIIGLFIIYMAIDRKNRYY